MEALLAAVCANFMTTLPRLHMYTQTKLSIHKYMIRSMNLHLMLSESCSHACKQDPKAFATILNAKKKGSIHRLVTMINTSKQLEILKETGLRHKYRLDYRILSHLRF
jgi:hypothetical protein